VAEQVAAEQVGEWEEAQVVVAVERVVVLAERVEKQQVQLVN
jgi:hypothetical protein